MAATATDLWPSIANTLAIPWRSTSLSRARRSEQPVVPERARTEANALAEVEDTVKVS